MVHSIDEVFDGYPDEESEIHNFDYEEFIDETDKAWYLVVEGKGNWFPKSVCQIDKENMTIDVPEWLAIDKEIL